MKNRKKTVVPFEYRMTPLQRLLALLYLPIHIFGLPLLGSLLFSAPGRETELNFFCFAVGFAYIVITCWAYLRREFDPLCDHGMHVASQVIGHYGLMLVMNLAVNSLLMAFTAIDGNPNNAAVQTLANVSYGKVAAMAICLAPLVEEVVFRGAIFGKLREKNRVVAYVVTVLLFALYHIWPYLMVDISMAKYLLQYLPISFLLCHIYESTGTIWSSIFLHMMVNAVSMKALESLGGLL